MKVTFTYDEEKDIWCLLNYGKSSTNSKTKTKAYEQLVSFCGENPTNEDASKFISKYTIENNINLGEYVSRYQKDWDKISEMYTKIAERVFGVSLESHVTAYLTINNRSPYSIEDSMFFVGVPSWPTKTVMHELWHFYAWNKFGITWEGKIGKEKYNEIKEALTVLLNVECKELLPVGVEDKGYPQHQELRNKILAFWEKDKNIDTLWNTLLYGIPLLHSIN